MVAKTPYTTQRRARRRRNTMLIATLLAMPQPKMTSGIWDKPLQISCIVARTGKRAKGIPNDRKKDQSYRQVMPPHPDRD